MRQIQPWVLGVGTIIVDYCPRISADNIRFRARDALNLYDSSQNGGCVGAICDAIKKDLKSQKK